VHDFFLNLLCRISRPLRWRFQLISKC